MEREDIHLLIEIYKRDFDQSHGIEHFLTFLRQHKCSKVESMGAFSIYMNTSLGEAKHAVHFSQTWRDRRISDEQFHEQVFQALDTLDHPDKSSGGESHPSVEHLDE